MRTSPPPRWCWLVVTLGAQFPTAVALACAPEFPPQLLLYRGPAAFAAPALCVDIELERPSTPPTGLHFVRSGTPDESDLAELEEVARAGGLPQVLMTDGGVDGLRDWVTRVREAPDALEALERADGLPREFALYLAGAVAFHRGALDQARGFWSELLALRPAQRRYRSTWAAFMLGRVDSLSHPDQAVAELQRTRQLATSGFRDALGLAEDSLGWEAQVEWRRGAVARSLDLYRQQWAARDEGGLASLRLLAQEVLQRTGPALVAAARDPELRHLVTGALVTRTRWGLGAAWDKPNAAVERWLQAVEGAKVAEVEGADRLGWLAYRYGAFDSARRWAAVAPASSALTPWLRSKLALLDGDLPAAADLLTQAQGQLSPTEGCRYPMPYAYGPWGYESTGFVPHSLVGAQLAIVRLAQEERLPALDVLVRSGYWLDAAYVAERLVPLNALQAYVDANWGRPASSEDDAAALGYVRDSEEGDESLGPLTTATGNPARVLVLPAGGSHPRLRALLGRRLWRAGRIAEAATYLPMAAKGWAEQYLADEALWSTRTNGPEQRARARWNQAALLRAHGMELRGTEAGPDWAEVDGNYDLADEWLVQQATELVDGAVPISVHRLEAPATERALAKENAPQPEARFHYRDLAAAYAVEAAQMLPATSEPAARMLCHATGWLLDRHPAEAKRIYRLYQARGHHWAWGRDAFGHGCPEVQ